MTYIADTFNEPEPEESVIKRQFRTVDWIVKFNGADLDQIAAQLSAPRQAGEDDHALKSRLIAALPSVIPKMTNIPIDAGILDILQNRLRPISKYDNIIFQAGPRQLLTSKPWGGFTPREPSSIDIEQFQCSACRRTYAWHRGQLPAACIGRDPEQPYFLPNTSCGSQKPNWLDIRNGRPALPSEYAAPSRPTDATLTFLGTVDPISEPTLLVEPDATYRARILAKIQQWNACARIGATNALDSIGQGIGLPRDIRRTEETE